MLNRPLKRALYALYNLDTRGRMIRTRFPMIEARLDKFRDEILPPAERPEGWICVPFGVYIYKDRRALMDLKTVISRPTIHRQGEYCADNILHWFPDRTVRFKLGLQDFMEFKEEFLKLEAERAESRRKLRECLGGSFSFG